MSTGKATFESSNPTQSLAGVDEICIDGYSQPERRKDNRRSHTDRRLGVRFDLTSIGRRQNPGRRDNDKYNLYS